MFQSNLNPQFCFVESKNTGTRNGLETVQLYVSDEAPKVFKELKAFAKVFVAASKESIAKMKIKVSDLAYFDDKLMKWVVTPGSYKIMADASSQDIRASSSIVVE